MAENIKERIVVDAVYLNGNRTLSTEKTGDKYLGFDKRITAINNMYIWLYKQGILQKVAFEFHKSSDTCYCFAFDTSALKPYQKKKWKKVAWKMPCLRFNKFLKMYLHLVNTPVQSNWAG